ncbi:Bug family tripartite tricarboxylate transporter substrate binding protein [Hydrogenophaga intermedia]|uniref:Bug family tripartite tricarboxylate transporter substrate binding protein n=1 Tax=Hydrogenophaga intermedia TaxID=65786 RepID=UPI0020448719|nr:tripartite tricarboxylate transporter substrate binding protein [Hydrogenophaga intermedia]MCM3562743.1 tripartite tricarboxylate transporter substrate binding protein [Hydrogenophaga intermedia]
MSPDLRRGALRAALALVLSGVSFASALAQAAYPNKPVRIIVPSTPAGVLDNVARTLALRLPDQLGQPIVIENRGGAGGNIGAEAAARSPADGYTLFIGFNATHGANLALFGKLSYDPVADFAPISLLAAVPNIVSVHPSVPVNSLAELVALAKATGKLSYASSGNGTSTHLAAEMFKAAAGIHIVHVPYKGSAPAVADVIAGQVPVLVDSVASSAAQVKAGKLKALATTSPRRLTVLPELPTVAESGYPGFQSTAWVGLLAPAGTPKAIIDQINAAVLKVMAHPETRERMAGFGAEITTSTPEEFAAHIRSEMSKLGKVVRDANIKVN